LSPLLPYPTLFRLPADLPEDRAQQPASPPFTVGTLLREEERRTVQEREAHFGMRLPHPPLQPGRHRLVDLADLVEDVPQLDRALPAVSARAEQPAPGRWKDRASSVAEHGARLHGAAPRPRLQEPDRHVDEHQLEALR